MSTLVCFHAHPDDEAIATGGTMLLAAQAGHRVVLVLATAGEEGEPVAGVLDEGEELGSRRMREAQRAAEILGVSRVAFLGYRDSGMMGEPTNEHPDCFWQARPDEAAQRLADLLIEESADVLTVYDPNGGYGHPDHIQVHRVGMAAAGLAGVGNVYWSTMNRTRMFAAMAEGARTDAADIDLTDVDAPDVDPESFGMPEEELTHVIDVGSVIDVKRQAIAAHASQVSEEAFFLALSDEHFAAAFGLEWFCRPDQDRRGAPFATSLFAR